jgi:hypothetical protein
VEGTVSIGTVWVIAVNRLAFASMPYLALIGHLLSENLLSANHLGVL